jgi:hypothetical protein
MTHKCKGEFPTSKEIYDALQEERRQKILMSHLIEYIDSYRGTEVTSETMAKSIVALIEKTVMI